MIQKISKRKINFPSPHYQIHLLTPSHIRHAIYDILSKIIDCDTVNLATSDVVEIIRDGCGVGSTSDPDHPAGNEQALDFSFFPQLRTDNDNFTDEFFRLSCSTQLCDILDTSTTCALPTVSSCTIPLPNRETDQHFFCSVPVDVAETSR